MTSEKKIAIKTIIKYYKKRKHHDEKDHNPNPLTLNRRLLSL